MITVENLTFQYREKTIFAGFTWQVLEGESWVILGPSGCGKSTLLALLAGLRFPTSGRVFIKGETLSRPRPQTGLILQDFGLLPWATVRQNASLGLEVRDFYGADGIHAPKETGAGSNVDFWLERLGLVDVANSYPSQISGGQRQRTAIARTLVLQPDLLLMDEPFSALDAPTRESLQDLTRTLVHEQNLTLVGVTHSIEEALRLGRKILVLNRPPNTAPEIIDNTLAAAPYENNNPQNNALYQELRKIMQIGSEKPS